LNPIDGEQLRPRLSSPGSWRDRVRPQIPKLLASLPVAIGLGWILQHGGLPVVPSGAVLSNVSWWAAPLAALTYSVSTYFRTCRWIHLLRPIAPQLSRKRVLGIGFVGFTAVVFAPFRSGEFVRPYLLSRDGQVSFTQALSSVAAERIIDGLIVTLSLFVALLVSTPLTPLPARLGDLPIHVGVVEPAAYTALGVFGAAFVAMGVFYWKRELAQGVLTRLISPLSQRGAELAARLVQRLAEGLHFLLLPKHFGQFLGDTAVYWLSIVAGHWALLYGCGLTAAAAEIWVVMGLMSIGILIPAGPGFFGAYQLSMYYGLAMFFPEASVLSGGAAFVFISYVANLGTTLLSCFLGLYLMTRHKALTTRISAAEPL
jgi:hypothetical protein